MSFPPLGSGRNQVRVQGGDISGADRSARELMNLTTQFYSASWWVQPTHQQHQQQQLHHQHHDMAGGSGGARGGGAGPSSAGGHGIGSGGPPQLQQMQLQPSPADIRAMLVDICANSNADVSYDKCTFNIHGTDDAVKKALMVISKIKWATQSQHQIRVKIELANDHKEFVSGKKNGKINKIMSQSELFLFFSSFPFSGFFLRRAIWERAVDVLTRLIPL